MALHWRSYSHLHTAPLQVPLMRRKKNQTESWERTPQTNGHVLIFSFSYSFIRYSKIFVPLAQNTRKLFSAKFQIEYQITPENHKLVFSEYSNSDKNVAWHSDGLLLQYNVCYSGTQSMHKCFQIVTFSNLTKHNIRSLSQNKLWKLPNAQWMN